MSPQAKCRHLESPGVCHSALHTLHRSLFQQSAPQLNARIRQLKLSNGVVMSAIKYYCYLDKSTSETRYASFAWAAITKYHRLGGLNRSVFPQISGGKKSDISSWFLLDTLSLACKWLSFPSVFMWSFLSVCVCMCPHFQSNWIRVQNQRPFFNVIISLDSLSPNTVVF